MRKTKPPFLPVILIAFLSVSIYLLVDHVGFSFFKSATTDSKQGPNDWLFRQRAYPYGSIDISAYRQASVYRKEKAEQNKSNRNGLTWEFCGPTNIGGRVTDIEMTLNPEIIFVGTASGGIFKSEDEGESWLPIFDDELTLSIGDLAIAPGNNDIIYAGTGEANAGGGSIAYDGNGIYRSDDRGVTWHHLGLENIGSVGKIVVNPKNQDECYVAGMGLLFDDNDERGIFKTSDGGQSWTKVLFINDSTGGIDLAIHPGNPDTVYAAVWERVRRVHRNDYGGPSSGIYRTMDGGINWQELKTGLPDTSGRIGIAISASDPEILYAFYTHETSGRIKGLYKSLNNGHSWAQISSAGISQQPYMWWFGKIHVDPADPDVVYLSGFHNEKSTDGGNTWERIFAGVHVDQHALYIDPANTDKLLVGNDGGVYQSMDGGMTREKLNGLPNIQFYTCEIDYSEPHRFYGGAQDNGILRTNSGQTDDWENIYFGDGFRVLVDPQDNDFVYAEYQYGGLGRSENGGQSFTPATDGINSADRNNWNTPVIFHPTTPSTLYLGTNRLYKSTDRAVNWLPISPDLTKDYPQHNLIFSTITAISVSPADDDIIYVGTDDGNVQVSLDDGDSWKLVSGLLPDRWVTDVAAHPENANEAYVSFSGFRFGENIGHIYKTSDYGDSWLDISGDLPDVPVNDIVVKPGHGGIFIATDIGVFYSLNDGSHWELLGTGMPILVCCDLTYHSAENLLVVATYGRGIYKITLDDLQTSLNEVDVDHKLSLEVFPNPCYGKAKVKLSAAKRSFYSIDIYTTEGRLVKQIHQGYLSSGQYDFKVDFRPLPKGIYICSARSPDAQRKCSIKIVLI